MADLEAIISGALADATDGADGGDEGDSGADASADTGDSGGTEVVAEGDEGADAGAVAGGEAEAGAAAAAQAGAAAKMVEDLFAKEHGINPLDQRKRENRIPYSRVKEITSNAEKKLAEAVLGKAFAADKPFGEQLKAHATRYQEIEQENQGYKTELANISQVEQMMLQRPEAFLTLLPHINPKFADLLANQGGKAEEKVVAPDKLPDMDVEFTMPDGSKAKTYSPERLVELVKAVAAQTEAKVLKRVDDQVKPFTDREQAARQYDQNIQHLTARVNHARQNWKGFKDWEADIQAELRQDREQAQRTRTAPTLDLQDAYIRVRDRKHDEELGKLKTDREAMRKDIVAELNKRPKSTAVASGVARRTTGTEKPKTMEDVIKAAMEEQGIS